MSNNLHILSHPLVNARLAKLREVSTTSKEFREGIHGLSIMLGYEASRDLEEITFQGQSPISSFRGSVTHSDAPVYHLGIYREKVSLQPLPPSPPIDMVFVLDPLIATGGTACAALGMITEWGIPKNKIKLLCILASEVGLQNVLAQYPGIEIWAAAVDPHLTPEGLISPGLGDTVSNSMHGYTDLTARES
ncbi:phosphoribosyltransferase-like protein [Lactifluus volemus]|nr:phosphoribosyltransferase-like protein [Lactifluus volemus]